MIPTLHSHRSNQFAHESFPVGPLQCNCTLICDTTTGRGLIVDPGGDADAIMQRAETMGIRETVSIIHTHAHLDHILASAEIKRRTGAPLALHRGDQMLWDALENQCARFGIPCNPTPPPDNWIADDEDLNCCSGVAMHTPGHTPGSICFWFEPARLLLAGDTLFFRSVGRTDLPGGSFRELQSSIRDRLFRLNPEALVIPGHGPVTRLEDEMRANPFVGALA